VCLARAGTILLNGGMAMTRNSGSVVNVEPFHVFFREECFSSWLISSLFRKVAASVRPFPPSSCVSFLRPSSRFVALSLTHPRPFRPAAALRRAFVPPCIPSR
ncbi:unnamed protein product, partial [Phaeothamnion confervicola]